MALIVPVCSPCHVSIHPPSKAGWGMEIETACLRPGVPHGHGIRVWCGRLNWQKGGEEIVIQVDMQLMLFYYPNTLNLDTIAQIFTLIDGLYTVYCTH